MPLTHRMLIESLGLHCAIPLDPAGLDHLQLVLFEDPECLLQHNIIVPVIVFVGKLDYNLLYGGAGDQNRACGLCLWEQK